MASERSSGGIGILGVLFVVFLVLKLTGTITWSWWWVTAPIWGPFVLVLLVLAVAMGAVMIHVAIQRKRTRR